MAGGNGRHEGGAHGERIRAKYAARGRLLEARLVELDRDLPPYRDELDSEVTANRDGLRVRAPLTRFGRNLVAAGLFVLLVCVGVWLVR